MLSIVPIFDNAVLLPGGVVMRLIHFVVLSLAFLSFPSLLRAEMVITVGPVDSVFVGDHLQEGVGFQNSREVRPSAGILEKPSRVQVYTGAELGSDIIFTRIAVCDESDNDILLMPIDSDGDARGQMWYSLMHRGAAKCSEFVIHRSQYFLIGEDPSTIEVYPYAGYVDVPGPSRILRDFFNIEQRSLKTDGQYLYALTAFPDILRYDLENEVRETGDPVVGAGRAPECPAPWSAFEIHGGLAYVVSGEPPRMLLFVCSISMRMNL